MKRLKLPITKAFVTACLLFYIAQRLILYVGIISHPGMDLLAELNFKLVKQRNFLKQPRKEGMKIGLFFGASKVTAGLIPELFDKEVGGNIYSYNLSTPALTIDSGYYALKQYLQSHPAPEYIIIRANATEGRHDQFGNSHWEKKATIGKNMADIFEYAFLAKNTNILFNYFLPSRIWLKHATLNLIVERHLENIWGFITKHYKQHNKWPPSKSITPRLKSMYNAIVISLKEDHEKRYNERVEMWRSSRGWHTFHQNDIPKITDEQKELLNEIVIREIEKSRLQEKSKVFDVLPELHNPYAYKFFDLAKEYNIKVLLIKEAASIANKENIAVWRQNQVNETTVFWRSLKKYYDNIYFAGNISRILYYGRDHFADFTKNRDGHHLNRKGAERYTKEVAREFKSVFNDL